MDPSRKWKMTYVTNVGHFNTDIIKKVLFNIFINSDGRIVNKVYTPMLSRSMIAMKPFSRAYNLHLNNAIVLAEYR